MWQLHLRASRCSVQLWLQKIDVQRAHRQPDCSSNLRPPKRFLAFQLFSSSLRGQALNTRTFFSNFLGTPRICRQKSRDIPPKSLLSCSYIHFWTCPVQSQPGMSKTSETSNDSETGWARVIIRCVIWRSLSQKRPESQLRLARFLWQGRALYGPIPVKTETFREL